eukprot:3536355-Heterocapsa_arctica.AAC.1
MEPKLGDRSLLPLVTGPILFPVHLPLAGRHIRASVEATRRQTQENHLPEEPALPPAPGLPVLPVPVRTNKPATCLPAVRTIFVASRLRDER